MPGGKPFTPEQRQILSDAFQRYDYCDNNMNTLTQLTGLPPNSIKRWFAHERKKWRNDHGMSLPPRKRKAKVEKETCRQHTDSSAESLETRSRGNKSAEFIRTPCLDPHLDSTPCEYNSRPPPAIPHSAIHERLYLQGSPHELEAPQENARADDLAAALQLVKLQRFKV